MYVRMHACTVQLRCNFTGANEGFTCILEQFTCTCIELLVAYDLLPEKNPCKIIR